MPVFFFNFTLDGVIERDDIGTEFTSLEMAYLDICRTALDMSFEKLRGRSDPHMDSVEILDAERRPLIQVPFSDVLCPKPSRWPEAQCRPLVDSCRKQVARGKYLMAEIDEELRKIQTVSGAISANLVRLGEAYNRNAQGLPPVSAPD